MNPKKSPATVGGRALREGNVAAAPLPAAD